jgi:CRP-like cAMP-binding protein
MLDTLKETQAFAGCAAADLEKVAGICERISVKQGDRLLELGSPADHVYVVADGGMELRFHAMYYQEPQPIPVDRVFKGDLIGWSAIFERGQFTLEAVAMKDSKLLRIPAEKLRRLCDEDSQFGALVLKNVAGIIARRFGLVLRMLIGTVQDSFKRREPGA